jgi:RNA polymerase sigma-70 factor (ECF subfamily)
MLTTEETAALVKQIQNGNEAAFDRLFAEYQLKAVRTAALISGDVSLAEDIVQETFTDCFLNIMALKKPESFKSWFFRSLTRKAWKAIDKKNRLVPVEELYEKADSMLPPVFDSYPSEQRSSYAKLYKAIGRLGKKQRTTIVLYYFNGFSIKEIANATSSLEATVKSRLFSAKKQLKKSLSENIEKMEEPVYGKV